MGEVNPCSLNLKAFDDLERDTVKQTSGMVGGFESSNTNSACIDLASIGGGVSLGATL